jgi:Uma2 family endonuclease
MQPPPNSTSAGPYTASDIRPGEPYELSNGHRIECMGTGQRGARNNAAGTILLGTDPDTRSVGVDAGISTNPKMLRAPDIVIGDLEDKPGWAPHAPPLAVEYADTGQDESELRKKIAELLAAGTQWIWVVRQHGPRCVEVHSPSAPVRLARIGETLEAPGILRNPVPVSALYDPNEAQRLALRNLLQREGYENLQAVLDEGHKKGHDEGRKQVLLELLEERFGRVSNDIEARIQHARLDQIQWWTRAVLTASSMEDVFLRDMPPPAP